MQIYKGIVKCPNNPLFSNKRVTPRVKTASLKHPSLTPHHLLISHRLGINVANSHAPLGIQSSFPPSCSHIVLSVTLLPLRTPRFTCKRLLNISAGWWRNWHSESKGCMGNISTPLIFWFGCWFASVGLYPSLIDAAFFCWGPSQFLEFIGENCA